MDDLDPVAIADKRLCPVGATDHRAIQFDRYSLFRQLKMIQHSYQIDPELDLTRPAIQYNASFAHAIIFRFGGQNYNSDI